jgi:hypothetical protein
LEVYGEDRGEQEAKNFLALELGAYIQERERRKARKQQS